MRGFGGVLAILVYRLFVRKINIFETNKTDTCRQSIPIWGDRSDFVRRIYKLCVILKPK
jgi:hypothetical protein